MDWKDSVREASLSIAKKAVHFCEETECLDCPIYINDIDHRTRYEKEVMHIPCVENLIFELANGRTLD